MPPAPPPAPSRLRRSDFRRTRVKILAAARGLMAERGPESLTVSAVAHAAEINRTTAYQHFRTRDELVRAVTEELIGEVSRLILDSPPVADRIDHIAAYFVDHPEVARLGLYLLLGDNPFPREAWAPYLAEMQRYEKNGALQPGVDVEMLAQVLMSVAILWPLYARIETDDPAAAHAATARFARELKRLLLYGLFRPEAWPELVADVGRAPTKGTPA
jgi:AcrR family transcriptional regulator